MRNSCAAICERAGALWLYIYLQQCLDHLYSCMPESYQASISVIGPSLRNISFHDMGLLLMLGLHWLSAIWPLVSRHRFSTAPAGSCLSAAMQHLPR